MFLFFAMGYRSFLCRRGLTIIKTCCQVMMGLRWHPGKTKALAALRGIPGLDRAHLERSNTLYLKAKGQTMVTALCWCHSHAKSEDTQVWNTALLCHPNE